MKILLVCAGGMSTGLLMKKMEKYWADQGEELVITATGVGEYKDICKDYEMILVGPQVRFRLDEIKKESGLPTAVIETVDYGMQNCPNIMKLARKLQAGE